MDAIYYHIKFKKAIKIDVDQTGFIRAFQEEYKAELERLKRNGTVKKEVASTVSMINKVVYERLLNWYNEEYNCLINCKNSNFRYVLHNLVVNNRYALIYAKTLRYLHEKKV